MTSRNIGRRERSEIGLRLTKQAFMRARLLDFGSRAFFWGETGLVRFGGKRKVAVVVFADALEPGLKAVHVDVDDGRGEEREHLADDEAADDGDAERAAELGADAGAEGER
jgi:hypothetical protein